MAQEGLGSHPAPSSDKSGLIPSPKGDFEESIKATKISTLIMMPQVYPERQYLGKCSSLFSALCNLYVLDSVPNSEKGPNY